MLASLPVVILIFATWTIASELTLIIPLGILIVTLAWWAWMNYRRGRGPS
ncbi:MAG TPA: hypothetical protein VFW09_21705 [Solirubrobacteraceae bacterium]|jgi:hypothetical protein|nr:hypothetical protein [Solirubrobacteraceae bacterium]